MKNSLIFVLVLAVTFAENPFQYEDCKVIYLSRPVTPARLKNNITSLVEDIGLKIKKKNHTFSQMARDILSQQPSVLGIILASKRDEALALRLASRLKVFPIRTLETDPFWQTFNKTRIGWGAPFKDCGFFKNSWFYFYKRNTGNYTIGLFMKATLDRCDESLAEVFNGTHRCDETQTCISEGDEKTASYRCVCREGFYYPGGNLTKTGFTKGEIERSGSSLKRCHRCPADCVNCSPNGSCTVRQEVYLKTIILCVQLVSMGLTILLALIVFKQRKTKAIASGMWTILETILLGIFILYNTAVVRIFEPSVIRCLAEPWIREVGFVICYGAIILKLYRHLIEFRTRKAHRWVVKDTDLLKYLLIMIMSVLGYMAAYTSITLNFMQENYSLLYTGETVDGEQFQACKYLWWDYVTETGELVILVFGIHLAYSTRNARTQFHERTFLCAAISIELAVSTLFYIARVLILYRLHPDVVLIVYSVRTQFSQTLAILLIFVPKFWYQQKQVRSLGQEYSCRLPLDAFKPDVNTHGPLTGNNSDVEIGEITIADMSPDDIRAELKRLYLQLEMFKAKTICRDNPHISKRRGGRKPQHRRFSLQKKGSREKSLHAKHKDKDKKREAETEVTEAEPSRTPEDSVCSNEGPSVIYADLSCIVQTCSSNTDHK